MGSGGMHDVADDVDVCTFGMGSAGFGDDIGFADSFNVTTTGLTMGDDVAVDDVTSHFDSVTDGFSCCCGDTIHTG